MDPHLILSEAFEKIIINGRAPLLITYDFSRQLKFSKIDRIKFVLLQNFKIIKLIRKIVKVDSMSQVLVREFSNIAMLFFCVAVFNCRSNIIFNINHNLKNIENNFPLPIYVLAKLGFKFLMLDGYHLQTYIPAEISEKILIYPFPCRRSLLSRPHKINPNALVNIGIVGDFRSEKGSISEVSQLIEEFSLIDYCNIKIGARDISTAMGYFKNTEIQVESTETKEQYHNFLNKLDVLIIFARRENYFSRHSGTIMDAVGHGVIVIAPNFPVFKSQLEIPVSVGMTYNFSFGIKDTFLEAMKQFSKLQKNREIYFDLRETFLNINIKND